MNSKADENRPAWADEADAALEDLQQKKDAWARLSLAGRIAILDDIKTCLHAVAEGWVETAARKKGLAAGSPLVGEEWLAGPVPVMDACNQFARTLAAMDGKRFLDGLPTRVLPNGQTAVTVMPGTIWDRLLFMGLKAEIWMQPGVGPADLAGHTASAYDVPAASRTGKVALVLGAGNVAAIAPLDCFQKLFVEYQVVLLKMNPVNDYLADFLRSALRPLIDFGALRIVHGGSDVGAYLCEHGLVEEIHITGAAASHDAIVWGAGEEGRQNKERNTPRNARRITSELGGVCPTIVVPGPWSASDIAYHGELIATQKLNNSGFNCVACQMLVLPEVWQHSDALLAAIAAAMGAAPGRPLYYPGAFQRMAAFEAHASAIQPFARDGAPACIVAAVAPSENGYIESTEVFAPAMGVVRLPGQNAEDYLRAAIAYANDRLHGTLGANLIIHPTTIAEIGRPRFETLIADLRYGGIAINAWTGVIFALARASWGAFPGHTLRDVQSGIGAVHNACMFEKPERTVLEAPFRSFPKPVWFISHRKGAEIGRLLTALYFRPRITRLPGIIWNALWG